MQNKYIEIDETTWPRAMHCAIFRNSVEPAFCITFEADITAFKKYVKDNATPLFDWGKYYEKDGKLMLPISVQGHHSFVDGIHVGEFVDTLEKYLNSFTSEA